MFVRLRPVFSCYGREPTEDLVDVYFTVLGRVPRKCLDLGVKTALSANREFMPPPGVLLSMCKVPPRFNGDGVPLYEETRRRELSHATCSWHSNADNWHGDDPPPMFDKTCPRCRDFVKSIPAAPEQKRLR
jgi:hypothetical protein